MALAITSVGQRTTRRGSAGKLINVDTHGTTDPRAWGARNTWRPSGRNTATERPLTTAFLSTREAAQKQKTKKADRDHRLNLLHTCVRAGTEDYTTKAELDPRLISTQRRPELIPDPLVLGDVER